MNELESGAWIGATRRAIQEKALNGEKCQWSSNDILTGMSVRDVEETAWSAIQADRSEASGKLELLSRQMETLVEKQQAYIAAVNSTPRNNDAVANLQIELNYITNAVDRILKSMHDYRE